MLNLKMFTRISLVTIMALMAFAGPIKLHAQDDINSDGETILSPPVSPAGTPPTIIDDSDSQGVSDVEEYDG